MASAAVQRGEVFFGVFPFVDPSRSKARPVCVLSVPEYNRGPNRIVAMISSVGLDRPRLGDVALSDWRLAGLARPSMLRGGRLTVLEAGLLRGPMGRLSDRDLGETNEALRTVLGL